MDCAHPLEGSVQTNNRAEISAMLFALQQADALDPARQRQLVVYTDSMLLRNTATTWMPGWKQRGWRKADRSEICNLDLVKKLDEAMSGRDVAVLHVKAHSGKKDWASIHNERADKLATGAVKSTL
jgi:ribonuclease HI